MGKKEHIKMMASMIAGGAGCIVPVFGGAERAEQIAAHSIAIAKEIERQVAADQSLGDDK